MGLVRQIAAAILLILTATASAQVLIVDNDDSGFIASGSGWFASSNTDRIGATTILNQAGTGTATATWTPNIPVTGSYDVHAWWSVSPNRTRSAPYTINHAGGSSTVEANQESGLNQWNYLGRYTFNAGTSHSVVLTDDIPEGTDYVSADAIRFERITGVPETGNIPLVRSGSEDPCNLCGLSILPGTLEDHPSTKYYLISDVPEKFGYPSAGPTTRSEGVLYSTATAIPLQSASYPPSAFNTQTVNGFTTIDDDFTVFIFHIAQPGDGSRPRRIAIYAKNKGTNSVTIDPRQVIVTDGIIGNVHEMESTLGEDFMAGNYDSTGLPTSISIPAGDGAIIGFSKKFALIGNGTYKSQNINCFGLLNGTVSGTSPDIELYIVAIDTNNTDIAPNVSAIKSDVESILSSTYPAAPELEDFFDFNSTPTGCALRRATGVFPGKVWRSEPVFDLNTIPGGASFTMGLDDLRTSGCPELSQTVDALLHPPYLRGESIGNYHVDHRVQFRVQNSGDVTRTFDLQFGNTVADIGLSYQIVTSTSAISDSTVNAAPVQSLWAGPNQSSLYVSFTGSPITVNPGGEAYFAVRFQILGNSSTPFQLRIPDTRGPEFDQLDATPDFAKAGTSVGLTFIASETTTANPTVTVEGSAASFTSKTANSYAYGYTVAVSDPEGSADVDIQANDGSGNTTTRTISDVFTIDRSAPTSGATTEMLQVGTGISGSYSASDSVTTVAQSRVYTRKDGDSWIDQGLVTGGTFAITLPEPGKYFLDVVSTDALGNSEPTPAGTSGVGDATVIFNTPNGLLPLNVTASPAVYDFPMEAGSPIRKVTIEFLNISGTGTVSVQRNEGITAIPAPLDPANAIDEYLSITATSGISPFTARILWDYDNANGLLPGEILYVYRNNGGALTTIPATATSTTITINSVDGFSDWYAGDQPAGLSDFWLLW